MTDLDPDPWSRKFTDPAPDPGGRSLTGPAGSGSYLIFVVIEKICFFCQTGSKSSMFLIFLVESEHFAEISSGL